MKNLNYVSALSSGYLLLAANIFAQVVLAPYYLKYLDEYQFGVLMILLAMVNFSAIGINWMSAGYVRIIGECWQKQDYKGFRVIFSVAKYIFSFYACLVVILGAIFINVSAFFGVEVSVDGGFLLLFGMYLVLNYEALPERQAFVGANKQDIGNIIELCRVLVFIFLVYALLPWVKNISVIWWSLIVGVLFQRLITKFYWQKQVSGLGWSSYSANMKPIIKRLMGKQGVGYAGYGALVLLLQSDIIIVGAVGGAEAAGQFFLLWKIPEVICLLLWRIPSTLEPKVIQMDTSGKHKSMLKLYDYGRRRFFVLVVAASLCYMAFGMWLAQIWVGDSAPSDGWMYVVSGFAVFFLSYARWPVAFAHATIRLRGLFKVALIEFTLKLLLILLLFGYFGIATPIVATLIVHVFFAFWAYQKLFNKEIFCVTNHIL